MRIYFVRHGESEANVLHVISNRELPHGLTEKGREQARRLGSSLKQVPVTRIYSSPILRARQTSEIISRSLDVPFYVTPALREYDCGILEGKSDQATWREYGQVSEDWIVHAKLDSRPEQGESFLDMQSRFIPFIQQLVNDHPNPETVLVLVSHGGLYRCMLPLVLTNITDEFSMNHQIGNTAFVVAELSHEGLVCLEWCGDQV